jgi:hypothetical protein
LIQFGFGAFVAKCGYTNRPLAAQFNLNTTGSTDWGEIAIVSNCRHRPARLIMTSDSLIKVNSTWSLLIDQNWIKWTDQKADSIGLNKGISAEAEPLVVFSLVIVWPTHSSQTSDVTFKANRSFTILLTPMSEPPKEHRSFGR